MCELSYRVTRWVLAISIFAHVCVELQSLEYKVVGQESVFWNISFLTLTWNLCVLSRGVQERPKFLSNQASYVCNRGSWWRNILVGAVPVSQLAFGKEWTDTRTRVHMISKGFTAETWRHRSNGRCKCDVEPNVVRFLQRIPDWVHTLGATIMKRQTHGHGLFIIETHAIFEVVHWSRWSFLGTISFFPRGPFDHIQFLESRLTVYFPTLGLRYTSNSMPLYSRPLKRVTLWTDEASDVANARNTDIQCSTVAGSPGRS